MGMSMSQIFTSADLGVAEEWRSCAVVGLSRYEVSESGKIRAVKGQRPSPWPMRGLFSVHGRRQHRLVTDEGKKIYVFAHRLVLLVFIGSAPTPKHECAHNDGDRNNNHYTNLRWATHKENQADMKRHGTAPIGTRHGMAKLTELDVIRLRQDYKDLIAAKGLYGAQAAISRKYGVACETVADIVHHRHWKHV